MIAGMGHRMNAGPFAVQPMVWVLHDGKAGMAGQAVGLAEAAGFPFAERRLSIRLPWRWLPPHLWLAPLMAVGSTGSAMAPPWPDVVIGCGRNTVCPSLAIRRASGGRTLAVQVQDPRISRSNFDMLFIPEHDRFRGPQVVVTRGAIHRVTAHRLVSERSRFPALEQLPRPVLGVLIGGSNGAYRMDLSRLSYIADTVASVVRRTNGSALVTPSRRTGDRGIALLLERFAGLPGMIWDGVGDNPYYAYLALADFL